MNNKTAIAFKTEFEQDVYHGLTDYPKNLSSRYFYDKKGDKLFQDIMAMPEYYLTRKEEEILHRHASGISRVFRENANSFDLIELGAGDGQKTKILFRELQRQDAKFSYLPVDISQNALDQLELSLAAEFPNLKVRAMQGTYFKVLKEINRLESRKKVILFLGSNIGNLLHPQAVDFLRKIRKIMGPEDIFFAGFDQKKNPQTVLDAYNDKGGITEAFNKNLLARINRELGANFNLDKFRHWEVYDPESGTARSYLVSTEAQRVCIPDLDLEIDFDPWETIHTEISQKYDDRIVSWLSAQADLEISDVFTDSESYYKNYIFKPLSNESNLE